MPVLRCAFCIAALSTVSSLAWADNIVVNNSTFSQLPSGGLSSSPDGPWDIGAISGWTESAGGVFGQMQPNGALFNNVPTPTVAFAMGTGVLSQAVTTVQAGQTYTLSVDVGYRIGSSDTSAIALLINGVRYLGIGTAPAPGLWSTYRVTYTALASDVGAQMYIQLMSTGREGNFADVSLIDGGGDPVPEPSTFALLLAGAAAIWFGMCYRRSLADSRA